MFAADMKTIAIPKDANSITYTKVLDALKKDGVEFKLLEVDFKKNPQEINKIINSSADILFVTGAHLQFTIKNLEPNGVSIVFVGVKDVHNPERFKDSSAGVFRYGSMGELIAMNYKILLDNKKMVMLYEASSKIERLAPSFLKKADRYKVNLHARKYSSSSEFDAIFRELKKEGFTSVLIFPPSIEDDDFPLLIEAQNRYKLPVLAQRVDQIQRGATAGTVANYELIVPFVKLKLEKLIEGAPIVNLKNDEVAPQYVINIKSVSELDAMVDEKIIEDALVVF